LAEFGSYCLLIRTFSNKNSEKEDYPDLRSSTAVIWTGKATEMTKEKWFELIFPNLSTGGCGNQIKPLPLGWGYRMVPAPA